MPCSDHLYLTRPFITNGTQPQFVTATVLPNQGMQLLQVTAYLPQIGIVNLLHAPALVEAKQLLADPKDIFANNAFKMGCALLLPYANRIRGKLMPDGKTIETWVAHQKILLPANNLGTEKHAIHGLAYALPFSDIQLNHNAKESTLSGTLQAGNFNGSWFSQTKVTVTITLANTTLDLKVCAKNAGDTVLPMGIGMHPYFAIPSEKRAQATLYLAAEKRALVNNYQQVFPTGKLVSVKDTPYDFTATTGTPLNSLYLDDSFTQLKRPKNQTVVATLTDPATQYGLHIHSLSPAIRTIQIYAPIDKNFIAVEPQFNLADPYATCWQNTPTGMVLLQPGQSTHWHTQWELFAPNHYQHRKKLLI